MVVADSSPLIYLAVLNDFGLLQELFGTLVISLAVYDEVVIQGSAYPVAEAVAEPRKSFVGDESYHRLIRAIRLRLLLLRLLSRSPLDRRTDFYLVRSQLRFLNHHLLQVHKNCGCFLRVAQAPEHDRQLA